jgi:hypothetical protein
MRKVPHRTASLCIALILLAKQPALAQDAEPTPQEEARALEALRAGLGENPDGPSPFDPHSAKTWDLPPQADIAPGLHTNLFQPSTEILSATADGDWLPGSGMLPVKEKPQEDRATASASPDEEIAQPPSNLAAPPSSSQKSGKARAARKTHSTLRSGRASLDAKPAHEKKPEAKLRKAERAAPRAPAVALPGELQP